MSELVLVVPGAPPLQGVLTLPRRELPRCTVILLAAGHLPRLGPHRVYVPLARRFAQRGFAALRFDFGGLGDSRARVADSHQCREHRAVPSELGLSHRAIDVVRVMDFVEERCGLSSFVLMGVCLSTAHAAEVAFSDARVRGLLLVNGQFLSREQQRDLNEKLAAQTHWREYVGKLTRPASWNRLLTGRTQYTALARAVLWKARTGASTWQRTRTEQSEFWRKLRDRSLPTYLLYSEGSGTWDAFCRLHLPTINALTACEKISVACMAGADHTFTPLASQRALFDVTTAWLHRTFPDPEPSAGSGV